FIRTGFDGTAPVGGIDAARGDDDFRLLDHTGLRADRTANLEPIAPWHTQITDHRVWLKLNGKHDPALAIAGFEHAPARAFEPFGHQLAESCVVVDYQSGFHWATSPHVFIYCAKEQ